MGYESAIGRYGFIGFGSKHDVRVMDEGSFVTFVRIDVIQLLYSNQIDGYSR